MSCCVCDKIYLPTYETDKDKTSFITNGVIISCYVPPAASNTIIIKVWFNDSSKCNYINDFNIEIAPVNLNIFSLNTVSATCLESKIIPLKDNKFIKKNFDLLPTEVKYTCINNKKVYFTFEYTSTSSVELKKLKLNLHIVLDNETMLTKKLDLKINKSCSLRIH
jgi:hypothetical protein